MKLTPVQVPDLATFATALHLYPTIEAVVEHNITRLCASGQPIATIKAIHTGLNAAKASSDDAGGLEAIICLTHGAHVMLTADLWVDMGLVNGAKGTVVAIYYGSIGASLQLPVAVTVRFDSYQGPTLSVGTVSITPIHCNWSASGTSYSCLQLPLMLGWAVTIHKAQGLTLDKVVIDLGKKLLTGLMLLALKCVTWKTICLIHHLLFSMWQISPKFSACKKAP